MSKLIPKYQAGKTFRWQRVHLPKSQKYGYVKIGMNDTRPIEFNTNTGQFLVYVDKPDSKQRFWTSLEENLHQDRELPPAPDYSTFTDNMHQSNHVREDTLRNEDISNENIYNLKYHSSDNDILRNHWLAQLQGSAHRVWYDNLDLRHEEFGEQGMSGNDPVGEFYAEGVGLGKLIEGGIGLTRYLKLLRNASSTTSSILNGIDYSQTPIDLRSLYKGLQDKPRQQAIIDYIYTGNKTQPVSISKYTPVKPIDYTSDFTRAEISSLPQGSKLTYLNEIIPRMIESRLKDYEETLRTLDYGDGAVNLSEELIQGALEMYRKSLTKQLNEMLDNRGYIEVSPQVMREYNYRHSEEPTRAVAFYDPSTLKIVVSLTETFTSLDLSLFYKFLNHEVRHWYDDLTPLTSNEKFYLKLAYNDVFDDLPNIYSSYSKGYVMNPERVTTNRDAREMIFGKYTRPKSIKEQNSLIDKLADDEIVWAVENANGYGRDYIRTLRERNMLTKDIILALRNAMKYVGASVPVGTTITQFTNTNN